MKDDKLIKERRNTSLWKRFGGFGVTAFFVIAAAVLLIFVLLRIDEVSDGLGTVVRAMTPVIIGIVMAYLMNPLMNIFESAFKRVFFKRAKKITRAKKICRVISLILTMVILICIITIIIYMLIPELKDTIMGTEEKEGLVTILPKQTENLRDWIDEVLDSDNQVAVVVKDNIEKATSYLEDFVNNKLIIYISENLDNIASGVWSAFGVVYDIILGIIFSVYILLSKDTFSAHAKKIVFSLFKRRRANAIIRVTKQCHMKFTGAITGKIVDSIIIGILCFIGMMVMDLPYRILISVIVAVTNIIPFFGPYIGGIPSAFLILCVDPLQALYFVIFIVVLQQFDCNFLDPRIVGESVGLSAFWVLFACVVFGALFGLPGMLLGVPVMACIYMIIKEIVEFRLKRKGLDPDTEYYLTVDNVDEQEMVVIDNHEEPVNISKEEFEERLRKASEPVGDDDEEEEEEFSNKKNSNNNNNGHRNSVQIKEDNVEDGRK